MGWSVIIREKLPAQIKERAAVFEKQDTYIQHQHYIISFDWSKNQEIRNLSQIRSLTWPVLHTINVLYCLPQSVSS